MSELLSDQSESPDSSELTRKRGIKIVAVAFVLIVVFGFGGFYYSGVKSSQSEFARGCSEIFKSVSANFDEYKSSSGKPTFDFGSSSLASSSSVRNDLNKFKNLADKTSRYSGAKNASKSLEQLLKTFDEFSKLKETQLTLDRNNPFRMELRVALQVFQSNIYRTLSDPAFERRLKNLISERETKYDQYSKKSYPTNLESDILTKSQSFVNDLTPIASLCRAAR
jgi:hypothetical protein